MDAWSCLSVGYDPARCVARVLHDCALATCVYVSETVRGAVRRFKKKSLDLRLSVRLLSLLSVSVYITVPVSWALGTNN